MHLLKRTLAAFVLLPFVALSFLPTVLELRLGYQLFSHTEQVQDQRAPRDWPMDAEISDLSKLAGSTAWMMRGYVMPYYPYREGQVLFQQPLGPMPSLQVLTIAAVIETAIPAAVDDGFPHDGDTQAMIVFTMPGRAGRFAMAAGRVDKPYPTPVPSLAPAGRPGPAVKLEPTVWLIPKLLTLRDPHLNPKLRDRPSGAWEAIEAHKVLIGMTTDQVELAIGRNRIGSDHLGGTYEFDGKLFEVTYRPCSAESFCVATVGVEDIASIPVLDGALGPGGAPRER